MKELYCVLRKHFWKISTSSSACLKYPTLSIELALWEEARLKNRSSGDHGFHLQLCSFPMHVMLHLGKSVLTHTTPVAVELFKPGFWGNRALQQSDFGNQERANFGRSFPFTGGAHRKAGTLNHWRSPGGNKQPWVLAQTSCLCQGMCHTPITLPPFSLSHCICSYALKTPPQLVSSPYFLGRQMRSSGSVQSAPFFLLLGRGNFSLMTQGKSRSCISGDFNSLISFSFTMYLDDFFARRRGFRQSSCLYFIILEILHLSAEIIFSFILF